MKQVASIRQEHGFAPQLQQGAELLQLPVMELRALIQREMEQNPVIEGVVSPVEVQIEEQPSAAKEEEPRALDFDSADQNSAIKSEEWFEYFLQNTEAEPEATSLSAGETTAYAYESIPGESISLQDHLLGQLHLLDLPPQDAAVAEVLLGELDSGGYFEGSMPDLAMFTGYTVADLERILKVIQSLDPAGVGARDPKECLLLQLSPDASADPMRKVVQNLDRVATYTQEHFARELGMSSAEVDQILKALRQLNPRPGAKFASREQAAPYVVPEIDVVPVGTRFDAKVDDALLPDICISKSYRDMLANPDTPAEAKKYLKEKLMSAEALRQNIGNRQVTIQRIAQVIVDAQTDFLSGGDLVPLTLREIAEKLKLHQSTVWRTVNGKYIRTPRGVLELKSLCLRGAVKADGGVTSVQSVHERIRELIQQENPQSPLSDTALQKLLTEEGFKIARRTVAKYREGMNLPAIELRRRV